MPDYNHTPVIPRVGLQANLAAAVAMANELLWTSDTFRLYVEQDGVKRMVGEADLPLIASTAEAQAGTNNTNIITPLRMREGFNAGGSAPVYACRAWVNFNGTGVVAIRASGNVSSITDNGVGNYRVNFTTAMPHENYAVVQTNSISTVGDGWGTGVIRTYTAYPTTSAVCIGCLAHTVWADADIITCAIFC